MPSYFPRMWRRRAAPATLRLQLSLTVRPAAPARHSHTLWVWRWFHFIFIFMNAESQNWESHGPLNHPPLPMLIWNCLHLHMFELWQTFSTFQDFSKLKFIKTGVSTSSSWIRQLIFEGDADDRDWIQMFLKLKFKYLNQPMPFKTQHYEGEWPQLTLSFGKNHVECRHISWKVEKIRNQF